MANPLGLLAGGAPYDAVDFFSDQVPVPPSTVNPATTLLAMPETSMNTYETIPLTAEQIQLAKNAADTFKNSTAQEFHTPESSTQVSFFDCSGDSQKLYESLKETTVCGRAFKIE